MSFFGDPSAATLVAGAFFAVVAFVIIFLLESVLSPTGGRLDMRSLADGALCGLVGIVGVFLAVAFAVHGYAALRVGVGIGVIVGAVVDVVALVGAGIGALILRRGRRVPRVVAAAGIALLAALVLFVLAQPAWLIVGVLVVPSVVIVVAIVVRFFFVR